MIGEIAAPRRKRGEATSGSLALRGLHKRYGDAVAVDDVSLDVRPGEFVTLLGPSGSGKTTTLRMVAGFTDCDRGSIELDGRELRGVPPYKRDLGMVFQNYALFPHMTAAQNIAFPLRMRQHSRREAQRHVDEALAMVHLEGLGGRYPRQLSGGQQQRVAVARAVVFNPKVLLMDEPLGALDKKLREALQLEILRLSRQLGITVIYVTHDQEEALVMSDRIAVYDQGRIQQIGTADQLYEQPTSLFVADFVGESNILRGRMVRRDGREAVETRDGLVDVTPGSAARRDLADGAAAAVVVRPERMRLRRPGATAGTGLRGRVEQAIYLGVSRKYLVHLASGSIVTVRTPLSDSGESVSVGDDAEVTWDVAHSVLVADEGATVSEAELAEIRQPDDP